jgi:hypothetical protein
VPADITTWINATKSNTGTTDIQLSGGVFTNAPGSCTLPTPP